MKSRLYISLKQQIIFITIVISCIISIIVTLICYFVFQNSYEKSMLRSSEYNFSLTSRTLEYEFNKLLSFSLRNSTSTDVEKYLKTSVLYSTGSIDRVSFNITSVKYYEALNKNFFSEVSPYAQRLIISTNDCRYYTHLMSTYMSSNYNPADTVTNQGFFSALENNPPYIPSIEYDIFKPDSSRQFIPLLRPVYLSASDLLGFLYMEISTDILKDALDNFPSDSPAAFVVLDGHWYQYEGEEFRRIEAPVSTEQLSTGYRHTDTQLYDLKHNGAPTYLLLHQTGVPGLSIAQYLDQPSIFSEHAEAYTYTLIGIFLVIMFFSMLLIVMLNVIVTVPINKLCQKITLISQGDFSKDESIEYHNELGNIGKCLNRMSANIQTYMKKELENERQHQELEYKLLQSQINPHFLYNTLNSIQLMASIQGAQGVADMITSLSRLMKYVSKSKQQLIPIREEFSILNDYFFIQRLRYRGGLKLIYEIPDDSLLELSIPRFSLQPLVENAIFHGIEPKGGKGTITIRLARNEQENEGQVQIMIEDDGIGMSGEKIRQVLEGEENNGYSFFKQVGLKHVDQIFKYHFGESYGIRIVSEPSRYTKTILTIPFDEAF